jgi:transcriptional regulator with XRE-family HTH domain
MAGRRGLVAGGGKGARRPTVRRRRLAAELRQLRKESGKTREVVAEFVGCSPVTITRIESAQSAPRLADVTTPAPAEVDRRVEVRMKRQEALMAEDGPKLWAVIDEGLLRRVVGGAETMRAQLEHLAGMSRANRIVVQVLTFAAGAHPGMDGSFHILRFPDAADPDAVYVQYRRGSIYLEDSADVAAYAELFDHLRARALGPDESRALILRLARELS